MNTRLMDTFDRLKRAGISAEQASALAEVVDDLVEARISERMALVPTANAIEDQQAILGLKLHTIAANTRSQIYMEIGGVAIVVLALFCFVLISRIPVH